MNTKATAWAGLALFCMVALFAALTRAAYFTNPMYMGALFFLQLVLAAVWNYRRRFFPVLVIAFCLADMTVPFSGAFTSGRWAVLGAGALVGYVLYMKEQSHSFTAFHLNALFCVVAASVSSMVSSFPLVSFAKTASLLLLFLYACSGARLAIKGQEERFFGWLIWSVEVTTYGTALAYFGAHQAIFGNPNSLGAVMGVVGEPLLLWGVFTTEKGTALRRRRVFALMVALVLLFFSRSRAGILAAIISSFALAVFSRRQRLVVQMSVAILATAAVAIAVTPSESDNIDIPVKPQDSSVQSFYLYKGKTEAGILGSRRSPWQDAVTTIQENPWFGTGFGTASNDSDESGDVGIYSSNSHTAREHGNSFLAILESVGLLGVIPFASLILLLVMNLGRIWYALAKTGRIQNFAVPLALVTTAGLVNACFEDWLFAVGYYLCVVFWIFAFSLTDYLPQDPGQVVVRQVPTWAFDSARSA